MVTLTLRVEQTQNGPRLLFHHSEIDSAPVESQLADLASGTYVQADCEYVAGVGMRAMQILAVTAHSEPSPKTSIRALVERREFDRALKELETLGEARVFADPTLLIARACARIGQNDEQGAAADLRQLLSVPGVTSLDVRDVFDRFAGAFGQDAALPLAKEFIAWVESRKPLRAISYLASIPPALWPLDLLLSALEDAISSEPGDARRVRQLLQIARSAAPQDPRVLALWTSAASKGLTTGRTDEP